MKNKKYIFIVQVTRQLCIDILNDFAKNGTDIELYTGEILKSNIDLNTDIKIHFLCKYNKRNTFIRLYSWTWFTIQMFIKLLFKKKDAELIFITTPPFTPFLGIFFNKYFHQKYHLLIWDLYPDALLTLKKISRNNLIYRIWTISNKSLLNRSSSIITIGNKMAEAIRNYSNKELKIEIIYNWIDSDYLIPLNKADNWFAKKYNQLDKLTVLYSGNLGETHDFETLLKAANNLKEYKDICFLIIGEGAKRKYIEKEIVANNLKNIILLPFQNYSVLPFSLTAGDISIVTLNKGMEEVSVPSKTYSILASGNAMLALASKSSELALIINKYSCGQIFENGDSDGITDFILSLYNNKELLDSYKKHSRIASKDFTPFNANQYYQNIFNAL